MPTSPKLYTYDGVSLSLPAWSKRTGINTCTLRDRIGQCGWTLERALTTPPAPRHRPPAPPTGGPSPTSTLLLGTGGGSVLRDLQRTGGSQ